LAARRAHHQAARPGRLRRHAPAGRLAAETLDFITPHVQPGISTGELDKLCHDFILDHKAIPAPLGYRGYPKSICTSINHVVCHGIPSTSACRTATSSISTSR
jgi:Methionine aminopeptidase